MKTIFNILWCVILGWELCLFFWIIGALCCITVIGIPFGKTLFKLGIKLLFIF